MSVHFTVIRLAEIVGGTVHGDGSVEIKGVADLREASPHDASWLSSARFRRHMEASGAGVILVPSSLSSLPACAIVCESVQRSVARLLALFAPRPAPRPIGVHPSAVVDPTALLGKGVAIGPHVTVESGVKIGDRTELQAGVHVGRETVIGEDCRLQQHVVIRERCRLGNRVTILPNSVVGADGFGFYFDENRHQRVPHIGGVVIEDDVEIGACSCVDRAKFGDTVIGAGTKIDNQVQLAHNVRVGRNCVIAAQSAIGGSTHLGDLCVLAGRAGAIDNIMIGDGAQLAVAAIAWADVPAGASVAGNPAEDRMKAHRTHVQIRRLPALASKVRNLTARLEKLEAPADHQP